MCFQIWFLDWLLWCKFAKFLFKSCPFAENNVNTFIMKFLFKDIRESFYIRNFERFFKINWCLLRIFSPSVLYFCGMYFWKILSTIFIGMSFAMNVSFRNSSSSLRSLISVHKSYALKISVLMEPVFVTIGTFDFQLMYFYVGVYVYIYV